MYFGKHVQLLCVVYAGTVRLAVLNGSIGHTTVIATGLTIGSLKDASGVLKTRGMLLNYESGKPG